MAAVLGGLGGIGKITTRGRTTYTIAATPTRIFRATATGIGVSLLADLVGLGRSPVELPKAAQGRSQIMSELSSGLPALAVPIFKRDADFGLLVEGSYSGSTCVGSKEA